MTASSTDTEDAVKSTSCTPTTGSLDPNAKGKREISVQANDFDIERKQSTLPARKRYIPLKFSDYRVLAGEEDEEDEDENFEPEKMSQREKPNKVASSRGRGRPRKTPAVSDSENSAAGLDTSNVKMYVMKVPSGYKCSICGKIFSLRGNAKTHLNTHTNERPFVCDFEGCGKALRSKESLRKHQLSHLGIKTFECTQCCRKFCSNASLKEHLARHTGEKPLTCEICGKKFRQICVLRRHMTIHSHDKPFQCNVCGRQFALRLYLQSHMKTHTGEKPFSCDICHKKFAHASDVKRHKITHSGEKRYPCSVCGKRFGDASSRKRHEKKSHQGPQVSCPLCHQQFSKARLLRQHLLKEHGTEAGVTYEVRVLEPQDSSDAVTDSTVELATSVEPIPQITTQRSEGISESPSDPPPGDVQMPQGWTYKLVPHQSQENVFNLEVAPAAEGSDPRGSNSIVHPLPLSFLQGESSLAVMGPVEGVALLRTTENGLVTTTNMKSVPPDLANPNCFQIVINEDMVDMDSSVLTSGDGHSQVSTTDSRDVGLTQTLNEVSNSAHAKMVSKDQAIPGQVMTVIAEHLISTDASAISDHLTSVNDNLTSASVGYVAGANVIEKPTENMEEEEQDMAESVEGELPSYDICQSEQTANDIKDNEQPFNDIRHLTSVDTRKPLSMNSETTEVSVDVTSLVKTDSEMGLPLTSNSAKGNPQCASSGDPLGDTVADSGQCSVDDHALVKGIFTSDYVQQPDLASQDYYNWLAAFAQECKDCAIPFDKDLFTKISHVQKTLSDFMAMPSGVICDKSNFKVLMNIIRDLSEVINKHLAFMFDSLS